MTIYDLFLRLLNDIVCQENDISLGLWRKTSNHSIRRCGNKYAKWLGG